MLDRVKVSLFAVIEAIGPIRGRVLDLFAGSGQLGIECLSRGAAHADFVEQSGMVCKVISQNLAHTKLSERAKIHQAPVERYLRSYRGAGYAMVVMDPPYADPQIAATIDLIGQLPVLAEAGLLVIGHSPRVELADQYSNLERVRWRKIGDSCFSIYERIAQQTTAEEATP
jgi:16S rRNA (guanine(966)-N(2))-methyltransferase RsmD